jgi:uncharacterized repeat protein (TIGR03803 family)
MRYRSAICCGLILTFSVGLLSHASSGQAVTEKVLYNFHGSNNGGWGPVFKLVLDSSGRLFGNTQHGGSACNCGNVFELTAPDSHGVRSYVQLYAFQGGNDGILPIGNLVVDAAGDVDGVTQQGGANSDGIVFGLSPSTGGQWAETILYAFKLFPDGSNPGSGLMMDEGGNLYGVMGEGGARQSGTVYKLTKNANGSWSEKLVSDLGSGAGNPDGEVTIGPSGNIYGTGGDGGQNGWGTVFELSPTSGVNILFNFPDPNVAYPTGELWRDTKGDLYGTAFGYSVYYSGAVYQLVRNSDGSWTETTLHIFGQQKGDGYQPTSGLTPDSEGNLYGTTSAGGAYGQGTVYKLTRGPNGSWTYSIFYNFGARANDGGGPTGGLVIGPGNTMYGTTYGGGKGGVGTVFEIDF